MNLGFKRIMSSVLAFVMLFSSLVMVNVVNVSAAEKAVSRYDADTGAFLLTADDFATSTEKVDPAYSQTANDAGMTFSASGTNTKQAYGTRCDKNLVTKPTNDTNYTFDNELMLGGNRTLEFTSKANGTVNVYVYNNTSTGRKVKVTDSPEVTLKTNSTVEKLSGTVTANTKADIAFTGGGNIILLAIEYIPDGGDTPKPTTYNVKMGNKDNTDWPNVTFKPETVSAKSGTVTASWEANDKYEAGSTSVTLQDAWFDDSAKTCTIPYSAISDKFVERSTTPPTPTDGEWYYNWTGPEGNTAGRFDISGNIDSGVNNVQINGKTYTSGLKLESSNGKIIFTTVKKGQLIIYLKGKTDGVTVNGTKYTAAAHVVTVDVEAGTQYTIDRSKSSGTSVLYIEVTGQSGSVEPPITTGYKVTVNIKDSSTSNPVQGMTVTAVLDDDSSLTATDNEDGTYTFDVAEGRSIVSISAAENENYNGAEYTPDENISAETTITLEVNPITEHITVKGTVTDKAGSAAIEGADVTVSMGDEDAGTAVTGTDVTDASGEYSVELVVPHTLGGTTATVTVSAIGYKRDSVTSSTPSEGIITCNVELTAATESTGSWKYTWTDELGIENDDTNFHFAGDHNETDLNPSVTVGSNTYTRGLKIESKTTISFHADSEGTLILHLEGEKGTILVNGEKYTAEGHIITVNLTADTEYTLTKEGTGKLLYMEVTGQGTAAPIEPYTLYVKVTDTDGTPVDNVKIAINGTATAQSSYADGVYTFAERKTATKSVSASKTGYISSSKAVNISADNQSSPVELVLEKNVNVTVKFTVDGQVKKLDGSNGSITIKPPTGSSSSLSKNDVTFTAKPGDKFQFTGENAANIVSWSADVDGVASDKNVIKFFYNRVDTTYTRYFTYTVPADAKPGSTCTVAFKHNDNAAATVSDTDKGDNEKALNYGEYGFGNEKISKCRNNARNYVDYAFANATMYNFSKGYTDDTYNGIEPSGYMKVANQFGILNDKAAGTYVEFQLAGADVLKPQDKDTVEVMIDLSGKAKLIDVTNSNTTVATISSKSSYELTPGHTYKLEDANGTNDPTYLKSIRVINGNNIFNVPTESGSAAVVENLGTYGSLSDSLKSQLNGTANDTDTVFSIITKITLNGDDANAPESALDKIYAVGYKVYDTTAYNAIDATTTEFHYNPGRDSSISDSETIPTPLSDIQFNDVVNTAVSIDKDGDGNPDIKAGELNPDDPTAGNGENLFVHTFFAVEAGKSVTLLPYTLTTSGGKTVYSNIDMSSPNNTVVLSTITE